MVVEISAVSLNYRDVLVVDHSPDYPLQHKDDLVAGSDGAGIVFAVGSAAKWNKGDRVVIIPSLWPEGELRKYTAIIDVCQGGLL